MGISALDPYRDIASPVHQLDARLKVAMALAFIVAVNLTPTGIWAVYGIFGLVLGGIVLLARLSLWSVLARSSLALTFVLMAAIGLPFMPDGRALASVHLLGLPITITNVGLMRFANIMVRAWLSVLASIALIHTTHFLDIMRAMRALGLPQVLGAIILLMYRYMYVLVDETQRLLRAREARSAQIGDHKAGRSVVWRAQVTGRMIGTLFLRTYERSERIYNAMLARGYTGELYALRQIALSHRQMTFGGLGAAALLGVAIIAQLTH